MLYQKLMVQRGEVFVIVMYMAAPYPDLDPTLGRYEYFPEGEVELDHWANTEAGMEMLFIQYG